MELLQPRVSSEQSETQITCVSPNVSLDQKCSVSGQPIPKGQANFGSSHPKQCDVAPANQIFSVSLFFILYSVKSVLSLAQFAVLQMETVPFVKCLFVSPKLFMF